MNVGIFIFDDIEVLDLGGPFEAFSVATRVKARLQPGSQAPFNVFTIGQTTDPVRARGGLMVTPSHSFADHPAIDLLIIPGGIVSAELNKESVIQWISRSSAQSTLTASVCTGSSLLAKAGLLNGKRATTHWSDIDEMRSMFPQVIVEGHVRWIEQGNIITSAGISAGIDMSLHLVSRLESETLAFATAKQMDYRWIRNPAPLGPESVVQQQLDAYNAHDVDALLATYAEDARLFEHPATLMASGAAQLRERFSLRFQEPNLHAHLLNRTVMDSFVIDHELVTRTFPEGTGSVELTATYEVADGKIINAWFLSGPKILDPQ